MTTSPAYQIICDLLIQVDGFGRIARRQWLIDAGLEPLEAHLPPDLPAINFAPALLDAAYQQGNDQNLRLMVTALQEVVAGHPHHLNQVNALLAESDLMKAVFPNGRVAWAEDRATTLAVAKAYFHNLPTDKVSPRVNPPDVPFPPKSHMPFVANPDFVGREMELMEIAEGIKTGQGAVVAAGMGGVGKTQLAVEWVHRYGRYFAGGVFWLDFSNEGSIPLTIASAGTAYQHLHYTQMELADQVRWVREQWKAETPTLLIFDNCEDPKLADEYAPIGSGARVLVTSRDQTMARTIRAGGIRQINIETLPRADSIKLLQRLRPDLSDEDANAIAEELGDLPLALHIAGSFLQQYRTTSYGDPVTYLERLRQPDLLEQLNMQSKQITALPTKHERNVERTFFISLERLEVDANLDPLLAISYLILIAQFAPGVEITIKWLYEELPEGIDEINVANALKRLSSVGLVEMLEEKLRIHRLVSQMITRLTGTEALFSAIVQSENILLEVQPVYGQANFVGQMERWLPHARHIATRALLRKDWRAGMMANAVGYQLLNLALYQETQYWYENALKIRQEALGKRHPHTALSLNNLSELYRQQGKYNQAIPLMEEALSIRRSILGTKNPLTASSINNLALLYNQKELYKKALLLYQEALAINREIQGPHHSDTALSLNNLAQFYSEQGRNKEALPLMQEALTIRREVLGKHPDTAISLMSLAGLYLEEKMYDRALPLVEEALAINKEVLGINHPSTAASLINLATIYRYKGAYNRALELYEEAISIMRESIGTQHPATASSISNLAELYRILSRYDRALLLHQEALNIRWEVLGERHSDTALSFNNLAGLYKSQGKHNNALPLFEKAVSILAERLGKEHSYTKMATENLNACRAEMKSGWRQDSSQAQDDSLWVKIRRLFFP